MASNDKQKLELYNTLKQKEKEVKDQLEALEYNVLKFEVDGANFIVKSKFRPVNKKAPTLNTEKLVGILQHKEVNITHEDLYPIFSKLTEIINIDEDTFNSLLSKFSEEIQMRIQALFKKNKIIKRIILARINSLKIFDAFNEFKKNKNSIQLLYQIFRRSSILFLELLEVAFE